MHQILEHMKETKVYKNRKLIKSGDTGEQYTVSIRKTDGRWACSCKGWIFRHNKDGTDCKHIEQLRKTYGNKNIATKILDDVTACHHFVSKTPDLAGALARWKSIKDQAEVMEFYLENSPEHTERAGPFKKLMDEIRASINRLALA